MRDVVVVALLRYRGWMIHYARFSLFEQRTIGSENKGRGIVYIGEDGRRDLRRNVDERWREAVEVEIQEPNKRLWAVP